MNRYLQNVIRFSVLSLFAAVGAVMFQVVNYSGSLPSFRLFAVRPFAFVLVVWDHIMRVAEFKFFLLPLPLYVISIIIVLFLYRRIEKHILSGGKSGIAMLSFLVEFFLLYGLSFLVYGAIMTGVYFPSHFGEMVEYIFGGITSFMFILQFILAFFIALRLIFQTQQSVKSNV